MNVHAHKRQQILQQMEQIDCMEQGSLQSETRPSSRDSNQKQGPYFKHQIWEQGRNVSRRIPAEKAPALAKAIEGRKEFEKLAGQFVEATVAMTRAGTSTDSKKNETKSRRRSNRKRPDTSSNS
jgi:DNA-binding transcriptional regulator YdaS (Cro superfamily)